MLWAAFLVHVAVIMPAPFALGHRVRFGGKRGTAALDKLRFLTVRPDKESPCCVADMVGAPSNSIVLILAVHLLR